MRSPHLPRRHRRSTLRPARPGADRGASSVEYGLIAFGIAATVAAAVYFFGGSVHELFTEACRVIPGATC